jgi:hypothetical protein
MFSGIGVSHFCHLRKKRPSRIIPKHLTKVKKNLKKMPPSRIK